MKSPRIQHSRLLR